MASSADAGHGPGGTEITRDRPLLVRLLLKSVLMPIVLPVFGLEVDTGAKRRIGGLRKDALKSDVCNASHAIALTGPAMEHVPIDPAAN